MSADEWCLAVTTAAAVTVVVLAPGEKTAAPACNIGAHPVPGLSVRSLPEKEFAALHAAVAPQGENERWAEIPWQTDLQAARRKAADEGKPLIMWIMDGHPLGCT